MPKFSILVKIPTVIVDSHVVEIDAADNQIACLLAQQHEFGLDTAYKTVSTDVGKPPYKIISCREIINVESEDEA